MGGGGEVRVEGCDVTTQTSPSQGNVKILTGLRTEKTRKKPCPRGDSADLLLCPCQAEGNGLTRSSLFPPLSPEPYAWLSQGTKEAQERREISSRGPLKADGMSAEM